MSSLSAIPLRDRVFFSTVYFVQGAMSLAGLAKVFFLKDGMGLNEVEFATLLALGMLPFTIKPLYGLISDFFPIFGRRRKFYLLIGSLINTLSWIALALWAGTFAEVLVVLMASSIGLAMVDVIADGMVIEHSTKETVGKLQTLCWLSLSVAALFTSLGGGYLLTVFTPQQVFLCTAVLPLLTFLQVLWVDDPRIESIHERKEVRTLEVFSGVLGVNVIFTGLFYVLSNHFFTEMSTVDSFTNSVLLALIFGNLATVLLLDKYVQRFPKKMFLGAVLFLFLWRAMPSIGAQFQYFIINDLQWDEVFLGYLNFSSTAGNVVGALIFWRYLSQTALRSLFFWTILIGSLSGLSNLVFVWQPEFLASFEVLHFPGIMTFALLTEFILGAVFYVGFLPLFRLAAEIIPKGVEATLFALVASFMNLGLLISVHGGGQLGGWMGVVEGDYENLPHLIIVASLVSLVLLPLLFLVPKKSISFE